MDVLLELYVVVVVIGEGLTGMRMRAEGPEAVKVHAGAQLERQARHDETRA